MDAYWITCCPTWLRLILVILLLLMIYSFVQLSRLRRLGFSGPRPVPFLGNMIPIIRKGFTSGQIELVRTNDKVFGMYFGHLPTVWVSDLDMVKRILIQDFSSFVNRENFSALGEPMDQDLIRLEGDHWKYVRSVLTPTFSSGKLREMMPAITHCTCVLLQHLTNLAKDGKSVEMKRVFGGFSMDVIANTAFGIQVDSQANPDDPFVKHSKALFDLSSFSNPTLLLPLLFPFLKPLMPLLSLTFVPKYVREFFAKVITEALAERRAESSNRKDFLQLMLNASQDQLSNQNAGDDEDMESPQFDFSHYKKRGLSDKELQAQAVLFFLAGYETTATSLMFTSYYLATNPECQEKLIQEIDATTGKRVPTYAELQELPYMDMVFSETLRICPPVSFITRKSTIDVTLNGYTIPNDMGIIIPVEAIHSDPELWPEPEKFDPERFSEESISNRHPMAYLPFGGGPRNCIGLRLAKLEAKMSLVAILQKFRFKTGPETEIPPKMDISNIFKRPVNGIWLRMDTR